jgi:hypothetical protein
VSQVNRMKLVSRAAAVAAASASDRLSACVMLCEMSVCLVSFPLRFVLSLSWQVIACFASGHREREAEKRLHLVDAFHSSKPVHITS